MRWLNILKKVGIIGAKTVPDILAKTSPVLGGLSELVLSNILHAEAAYGKGTGPEKQTAVLGAIQSASPLILKVIELSTGKDLADDEVFASGVTKIIDGYVEILNSIQMLEKTSR